MGFFAAATVAGHIVECGAQCSGGNFTGWREVKDFVRIGYPIVEASPDGTFFITKHEGTGGLIDVRTVTAQLLYSRLSVGVQVGKRALVGQNGSHLAT